MTTRARIKKRERKEMFRTEAGGPGGPSIEISGALDHVLRLNDVWEEIVLREQK